MKLTLSVEEYQSAPRDIRDMLDAWLEKVEMDYESIVEIRVIERLKNGTGVVAFVCNIRDENNVYVRDANGEVEMDAVVKDGIPLPPLDFFCEAVA